MLDINLNLYKVFYIVAKSKSYTDASNKMNISVTAISKNISQLEKQLDVQLFYRTSNGVKLTLTGEELFEQIDKSITAIELGEKIVKESNDLGTSKITIGCPSHIVDFYLSDIINKVKKDYPNLKMKIISGIGGQELIDLLENHKVDFIIDSTTMEIKYKDIIMKKIKEVENIFVSKNLLNIKKVDLKTLKYILPFEYTFTTKNLIDKLNKEGIAINIDMEVDITESRIKLAKEGLGIAYVMKDTVKKEIENKELYKVNTPIELPTSNINLYYVKEQLTKADKIFIKNYLKIN